MRLQPWLLLAAPLTLAATAGADQPPARAPRVVDYRIDVRLDAEHKALDGHQRLTWTNPSTDTVDELWFHLYLNAFRNDRSTFFRESGGQLRGDVVPENGWGWITIRRMALAGGTDLTDRIRFERPDDGNEDDWTLVRVPLPQPVPPEGAVTLDIDFYAKLPRVFARTGYHRDYYLVGQWFPKIAVYEPAGTRGRTKGGWNCHQFHANSEFYADFGRYRVNITTPAAFVVGATGSRVAQRANGDGTTTHSYEQEDVHDFAWTADPRFIEVTDRFTASELVTPAEYEQTAARLGRTLDAVRLTDVDIRLLMQPGRLPQVARYLHAVKLGLKYFGLWYGRYPYRTLTVVDPAPGAAGSGGMEYPTFITSVSSIVFNRWPFNRILVPEQVIVHEFGHQFWYGLVASNEFEEAWLDEGITSYSTGKVMDLAFGPETSILSFLGLRLGNEDFIRMDNSPWRLFDRIRQPAWTYSPDAYAFYSYTKPELALRTLEHQLGAHTMARVMRTYHERWRFKHPSSDDFYAVASEVAGQDLSWFFRRVFEDTGVIDYQVSSISSERLAPSAGLVEAGSVPAAPTASASPSTEPDSNQPWLSRVVIRRLGGISYPTDVLLRFEQGEPERITWDGESTWTEIRRTGPHRLVAVEIDPDRRVTLEVSKVNGSRRIDSSPRVALTWTARWMFWMQNLLLGAGL